MQFVTHAFLNAKTHLNDYMYSGENDISSAGTKISQKYELWVLCNIYLLQTKIL